MQKKSIFGPLLLIAAGVIWLLVRAGSIPAENLWALTHIWPYLLIAAGLGLILRAYWAYATILLDVLIVGGAVLAIVFAPQLGWANPWMVSVGSGGISSWGPANRVPATSSRKPAMSASSKPSKWIFRRR